MTLKEMKSNVLRLIEEYKNTNELTDDEEIANKINVAINLIMFDICKYKKLSEKETIQVIENQEIDLYEDLDNFNQLIKIEGVSYNIIEKYVTFKESGTAIIYYYKNPETISEKTKDTYVFELKDEVLAIMQYGIAADMLKNDPVSNYGKIYADKYKEALQMLDPRIALGKAEIEGGYDV